MKLALSLTLCIILSGCVMRSDFTPYVGKQATWPTAAGAFAKPASGIPIYHSLPERPYEVLGSGYLVGAQLANMNSAAARMAKKHGGDAALVLDHHSRLVGMLNHSQSSTSGTFQTSGNSGSFNASTTSTGYATPVNHQHMQVVIIKWKP